MGAKTCSRVAGVISALFHLARIFMGVGPHSGGPDDINDQRSKPLTTNLGVRSSNLFGRASKALNLIDFSQVVLKVASMNSRCGSDVEARTLCEGSLARSRGRRSDTRIRS